MIPSYLLSVSKYNRKWTLYTVFRISFLILHKFTGKRQFIKSAQEIGTHFWKTSFVTSYAEPSRLHVPLKNFCKMKLMIQLDVKIYRFFTTKYLICEFWSLLTSEQDIECFAKLLRFYQFYHLNYHLK